MKNSDKITIHYFTDILCVWAYLAQIRLDEVIKTHSSDIKIIYSFMPIFGHTEHRIGDGWKDKGGFAGFSEHIHEVCIDYPHIELHKDIWKVNTPKTSSSSHLFIMAVQTLVASNDISNTAQKQFQQPSLLEELIWQIRLAFFRDLKDVSNMDILMEIASSLSLPTEKIQTALNNGSALAAYSRDIEIKDEFNIEGSPTYILNDRRQKLYGNVGYRIIEANIQEILNKPHVEASWC